MSNFHGTFQLSQMSNTNYRETFAKIRKVKESNLALLNSMIQCVTTFTGKITKLIENLGKISNELPTKKLKKKNMFFKQESDDRYEVVDPNFTSTWITITSGYVCKPQGLEEMSEVMREFFIEKLKSVHDSYIESNNMIESTFQVYLKDFDEVRDKYTKAMQNYNSLLARIEQITEKLKPENTNGKNPDYIEKLKSQLSDAKDDFPSIESQAATLTEDFNEANKTFSISSERLLSEFERIDKEYGSQLRSVFAEFFDKYPNVIETDTKVSNDIQRMTNPNNIPQDTETSNIDNLKEVFATPNFPMPSFNISEFIDPSEVFNTELLQKLATVTSNSIPGFPPGSLVVILHENGKDITIADVVNMKSTVVKKSDIQIEKLKRTIAQLKEDYAIQTETNSFVWKANEYLLVTPHKNLTGQTVWCTDMFGRSGAVPFNKLNQ